MAQFTGEKHNRWDDWLPEIMLAINTSESESTGYTPAFLTQGRSPRLPKALYDELTTGTGARQVNPEERASELQEVFGIVRRNLEKAAQHQKRHYNLRRRAWRPTIGDHVLVRQHPLSKATDHYAAKLAPKFEGPYLVTKFVSPVIVEIRDLETKRQRTAHLSEIKLFHHANYPVLVSSTTTRSPKINQIQNKGAMGNNERKLERSRERVRHNMRKEHEQRSPTIHLLNDEQPSTSSGQRKSQHKRQTKSNTPTKATKQQPSTDSRKTARQARHLRMTTVNTTRTRSTDGSDNNESRIPSPPLMLRNDSPAPPPPSLNNHTMGGVLTTETLLSELHEVITKKKVSHQGERVRFTQIVGGIRYRITLRRDGTTQVNQSGPTN